MKRTAYARVPAVVLGGREQMCLNEHVREQSGNYLINRACRNAVAQNSCQFYSNYENKLQAMDHNNVHDIEDLISFGRTNQCCPYYASRKLAETKATIVFTPYNYILDPSLRKNQLLRLEDAIIIFDEAHNIENILEDCVSGQLTESSLKTIQDCVLKLPKKVSDVENYQKHGLTRTGYNPKNDDLFDADGNEKGGKKEKEQKPNPILEMIEKLTTDRLEEVRVASLNMQQSTLRSFGEFNRECSTEQFYSLLESCGINYSVSDRLVETLDTMSAFLLAAGVQNPTQVANFVTSLELFSSFVSLAFPDDCLSLVRMNEHKATFSHYYRAYLEKLKSDEPGNGKRPHDNQPPKDWTFHLWCLSPAIGLRRLRSAASIRSLIITSGTLAPLGPYKDELETNIGVTLESPHVISKGQLNFITLGKSPENYSLVSDFNESKKPTYHRAIGSTLLRLFKILPCGTVVFFQSYFLMYSVIESWKRTTIWKSMAACKHLFIEPKSKTTFASDIASYKRVIDTKNSMGAVFFGVCRGKLSEGVNLNDDYCRSVILTGPPFPGIADPRVQMKKKYLDQRNKTNRNAMNGQHWYSLQMKRALNQTIGRVIRSKDDFGLIILCDPRFRSASDSFSNWIKPHYSDTEMTFLEAERSIVTFFQSHGLTLPELSTISGEHLGAFQIDDAATSSTRQKSMVTEEVIRPINFKAKENAMVASYTVDKQTAERAREKVRQQQSQSSQQSSSVNITASSAFDSLCPSSTPEEMPSGTTPSDACIATTSTNSILSQPRSLNIFARKKTKWSKCSSLATTGSDPNYSILDQLNEVSRPASYKCSICLGKAVTPLRSNCSCSRVSCSDCWTGLLKRKDQCGKCNVKLKMKDFKPLLFNSASRKQERF